MSTSFQQIQSEEVYKYLRKLLTWDDSLSANLRTLPIEAGKCQILLPSTCTSTLGLELLAVNPVLKGYMGHNRAQAASYIAGFIAQNRNHIALFASFASLGDPVLKQFVTPKIIVPRSEVPPSIFLPDCFWKSTEPIKHSLAQMEGAQRGLRSLGKPMME